MQDYSESFSESAYDSHGHVDDSQDSDYKFSGRILVKKEPIRVTKKAVNTPESDIKFIFQDSNQAGPATFRVPKHEWARRETPTARPRTLHRSALQIYLIVVWIHKLTKSHYIVST